MWEQQFVPNHCRTAMYSSDWGFPRDPFYKAEEVGSSDLSDRDRLRFHNQITPNPNQTTTAPPAPTPIAWPVFPCVDLWLRLYPPLILSPNFVSPNNIEIL